jgi:hypothetical protein
MRGSKGSGRPDQGVRDYPRAIFAGRPWEVLWWPKIVKREGGGIWPIANRPQVDNLPYSGLSRRFFEITALEQASCVPIVDSAGISSVMEFITTPGDRAAHHNRPPLQEL